jgi:hypothetical protein
MVEDTILSSTWREQDVAKLHRTVAFIIDFYVINRIIISTENITAFSCPCKSMAICNLQNLRLLNWF